MTDRKRSLEKRLDRIEAQQKADMAAWQVWAEIQQLKMDQWFQTIEQWLDQAKDRDQ
jgi:hypothetical protein